MCKFNSQLFLECILLLLVLEQSIWSIPCLSIVLVELDDQSLYNHLLLVFEQRICSIPSLGLFRFYQMSSERRTFHKRASFLNQMIAITQILNGISSEA